MTARHSMDMHAVISHSYANFVVCSAVQTGGGSDRHFCVTQPQTHSILLFLSSSRMSSMPYGQNIRTRFPIGGYASTTAHASACLSVHSHPYSGLLWTAKAEGGGDGLETPAGVYYWVSRSGTAATQRVPRDKKDYSSQPLYGTG